MIDNDYVFELDLSIDTDRLISLYENIKSNDLKSHQHYVEDYSYLSEIKSNYSILGNLFNFYYLKSFKELKPHIDAKRMCAVNIPLIGCTTSKTRFYKLMPDVITRYDDKHVLYEVKENLEIDFEFTLNRPSLIRTDVPHSALAGYENRLILSWAVGELDFFKSKEYFKSVRML